MAFEPFNSVGGYTIGIPPTPVINENGVATLNGLQVTGLANLGSVGNVIILGGENGYFLQTDGEGRLTWAPASGGNGGNGNPGGANSQVQFNNAGTFGGDAGFTYDNITNVLTVSGNIVSNNFIGTGNITVANITANSNVTANYFIGNGSQLRSLTGANVTGAVPNATFALNAANANVANLANVATVANTANLANTATKAGTVTTNAQPNITSVGTLTTLSVSGNVTANYFLGNGSQLTGIAANSANFANYAGNITVSNQPNITGLGTLATLTVSGNVTANYFLGNGAFLTGVGNANYTPLANFANYAGNVTVSSQPNITSLGTLTTVTVSGNANIGNLSATQVISNLLPSSNNTLNLGSSSSRWKDLYLSGNSIYLDTLVLSSSGNSLSINGGTGNIVANNLTSVPAANIVGQVANALVASTVYTNAQPNITSVGTLTSVEVSGNANVNNLFATANIIGSNVTANQYLNALNSNLSGTTSLGGTVTVGALGSLTSLGNINFTSAPNVTLGTIGNIHIGGGISGYFLRTDGAGNLSWAAGGGGGGNGTPGGNTTEVQFNDNGVFGASANFTYNPFSYVLTIPTINTTTVSIANVLTVNTTANMHTVNVTGVLTASSNINATTSPNINLGSISNVHIQGGTNGYVLQTDGTGNLSWAAGGGGGNGVPGGSNTQMQFNDNGVFGGSPYLTFDKTDQTLQIAGHLIANTFQMGAGGYSFSNSFVFFATTASASADQVLWDIPSANVNSIDFNIFGTCDSQGATQSAKITCLVRGSTVVYNEYAGLAINGGVGSYSVVYRPADIFEPALIQLLVTPDSSDLTEYNMMITVYSNYP